MRQTLTLFLRRLPVHITLYSRATCSLCDTARTELARAWEKRPFEYAEVDVMKDNDKWRVYEFDVPVIHIARTIGEKGIEEGKNIRKLMHRFKAAEVVGVMEQVLSKEE
ncbi:hypothetical protein B9Z19DRAFT_274962 [Tuber borchii]|uniref:Glutaredoxin-like protein n=1 Tax=Tuber borchii TaxID=42251 RepID=A0A2T7A8Z7_TUBBO|nr:hypothetical protein B9Z19DRAFT_274962 [Tuber borchii]